MALDISTIPDLAPMVMSVALIGVGGWVFNNWMRMRHGYPLENSWGKTVYPQSEDETQARVQLLTQENAQLRAEVSSVKDRLASVERIVTDQGYDVARQIESLREARIEATRQ